MILNGIWYKHYANEKIPHSNMWRVRLADTGNQMLILIVQEICSALLGLEHYVSLRERDTNGFSKLSVYFTSMATSAKQVCLQNPPFKAFITFYIVAIVCNLLHCTNGSGINIVLGVIRHFYSDTASAVRTKSWNLFCVIIVIALIQGMQYLLVLSSSTE